MWLAGVCGASKVADGKPATSVVLFFASRRVEAQPVRADDDLVAVLQNGPLQLLLRDDRRVASARQVVQHEVALSQPDARVMPGDATVRVGQR